ncbi:hypothetical protein RKE25_02695 [Dyella sp. BiH032]|uniref:hypothetical protein n=1 Tax=Dyella sp. BiH032 TaxID=3075430 RepID=UPI0028932042|nr:hypothetical protein [Dyella sp. BiH032]WNL46563.1 hypothetical protein RKE25_02695 [Dyella sp. BiH032]
MSMTKETAEEAQPAQKPDDNKLRRRVLFDAYWTEQQTRERANSDKYDNTILAYSTGALGLSVTFIKELVPLASAHALWAIKTSWLLFAVSLLLMLSSFPIAGEANRQSVKFAHKYFIDEEDNYYNREGWAAKTLKVINPLAGLFFYAATGLTIAFVWTNIHEKEPTSMSEKNTTPNTPPQRLTEGVQPASMQRFDKGLPSASMPAAPAPAPAAAPAPVPAPAPAPAPAPDSTTK